MDSNSAENHEDNSRLSKRIHLMVVDDDDDILQVLRLGLTRYGHKVIGFSDPVVALEEMQLNSQAYMLLLTDIRMPRMSGLELAKKAKEIDSELKVLVMTAFELEAYDFSHNLPFIKVEDVLKKPFLLSKICQVIDKHLAH